MRVLIADKLAEEVPGRLEDCGCAVTVDASLKEQALFDALSTHDPQVLVVRSTKVRPEHIQAAPALALIVRAGAGVNTIDVAFASSRGIYVANCPGKNAVAVAELVMGQLVNLDRRIADNVADLRN
ncbi:MAG: hydroxyacid dehydrogenase, partial [Myxococcota bacterium]